MRRWYVAVIVFWIILSYAVIQRWPEAKVLVPFASVAFALPLVWVRSLDGQLLAAAAASVLVSSLSGFGQFAWIYFIAATTVVLLLRSLPASVSVRILVFVVAVSLLQTFMGSILAGYDTFFLAIFIMQSLVGFLAVRVIVNPKAFDYKR